jgi:alanyl-tRNA synthetase
MTARQLKQKYLDFFGKRNHQRLPNVSLIPENDPTALFINSGMHPLVPYLLGEPHPQGKRLVSLQRCLRTQDIEAVGDVTHLTFFEMLGNWSLGDYWKKEAISWSWEFLTTELNLNPERLLVTCFAGDKDASRDEETAKIWQSLGLPKERIYFLGKKDNWWAVGETGPCGPDTEMFYDTGKKKCGPKCRPGCSCGKYFEVWNDVFMQFNKLKSGKLEKLKQRNIDTGMGVERMMTVLQGKDDVYQTEVFASLINQIEKISNRGYQGENLKPMRIIADHLKAAIFMAQDGLEPSNKERGYVMRRLIRKAVVKMRKLNIIPSKAIPKICQTTIKIYGDEYFDSRSSSLIRSAIGAEIDTFEQTMHKGVKLLQAKPKVDGKLAFDLYQTYGFPFEVTLELLSQWGRLVNEKRLKEEFDQEFKKHQKLSKKGVVKKFAGGLADHSEEVARLHTATHLLHQALRDVLGDHVRQVGSNITPERLRFDFTHPKKLTAAEIKQIEAIINEQIKANLPVKMEMMTLEEAKKKGALAFFGEKYGEKVKVYSIGDYSQEVCGGPHVSFTGQIGRVKITKEESVGAGRRRLYLQPA